MAEDNPERSWERVVRCALGRRRSEAETAGGLTPSNLFGERAAMAAATASECTRRRDSRYESGWLMPSMRWSEIEGWKRDCRVCLMLRGPESAVTVGWEGWFGRRALRRNWEQSMDRLARTGSTEASWWRWSVEAILREPVAMRRAGF